MEVTDLELFIYRWDYIQNTVYGSSTEGRFLEISHFIPWKYVSGGSTMMKTLNGSRTVFVSKVAGKHDDALIQFLSVNNLFQTGWVKVSGGEVNGKCIKCRVGQVFSVPKTDLPLLNIVAFDIEVYSVDRSFPNPEDKNNTIICISTVSNINGAVTFSGNEDTFVGDFYKYIMGADIVVGYNTHGFDWKYILARHRVPAFSKYPGVSSSHISKEWSSSAYSNNSVSYLSIPGIVTIDLFSYCQRSFKINDYRLSTVAQHFNAGNKMDMPMEKMWTNYEKGDMQEIIKYCVQDCALVLEIVDKTGMVNDIMALSRVTCAPIEQLFTSGQQNRIRHMLKSECIKHGYIYDFEYKETEPYKGAYVLEPEPGMYDHCACMDFASLYPSIIMAENICYSTFRNGVFDKNIYGVIPNLIRRLVEERRKTPTPKAYSNALKICANSIYGVFGAKGNLNLMPAASRITQVGRQSLAKAADYLNSHGYKVIYGDTDSCIYTNGKKMSDKEHIKIADEVTSLFSRPMQMKFEDSYKRFLVLGKKMYLTIDYNDTVVYKGVLPARRDSSRFVVEFYKDVASRIMKNIRFRDHCREMISQASSMPKEMFIIKKTYKGPYKSNSYPLQVYNRKYGPLKKGETFWVFVSHGTTLGDRLRPADSNDPIDYHWYLEKLVTPVDILMETSNKVFRMKHNIID